MKGLLCSAAFIACTIISYAQTSTGKVVDPNNNPLSGATITVGGKNVASTDKDGMFTINCSKAFRITVSYVGYESVQHTIKNCNEDIRLSLRPAGISLQNVEFTATSNTNKSLLNQPASISKLGITELKRGTGLTLDDAIHANIPGVTMNRRTVGAGQQFNIRGYGN